MPSCRFNLDIVKLRRELVEHPFGSIKQWMNQGAFLMRRLRKVRAEFSLTALAYNRAERERTARNCAAETGALYSASRRTAVC
jgi:hypothetical protein